MNEHVMGWLNDKPAVMPPDLFMFLSLQAALELRMTG